MARENKKRLSMDLHIVIHNALAEISEKRNTPITDIVTQLILNYVIEDIEREKPRE